MSIRLSGGDPRLDWPEESTIALARRLLGQRLVRVFEGHRLAGRIVEVEAYLGPHDRACHTWGGRRTRRTESMYLGSGHAYIYFIYGLHHCVNVVAGRPGSGAAVLIRALEAEEGIEMIRNARPRAERSALCRGPGCVTRSLRIDRTLDGADLRTSSELFIEHALTGPLSPRFIVRTPRIGVDSAGPDAFRLLRFAQRGNPCVSGPPALRMARSSPRTAPSLLHAP